MGRGQPTVVIYEVGPRDGLQSLPNYVPRSDRIRLIRSLQKAGIRHIEAGSFVHPKWVPNMAESGKVFEAVKDLDCHLSVLVPNRKGVVRAQTVGAENFNIFFSPCEKFNRANYGRSYQEIVDGCKEAIQGIPRENVRAYLSMAFNGDDALPNAIRQALLLAHTVVLCDTDGTATPVDVDSAVQLARNYTDTLGNLAVHLHHSENVFDNLQAAYDAGVREFDSSIGGIGGCPFVKGAEANLATEELVIWCNGRNIDCGVKLRDLKPALKIIDRIKYQRPRSRLRYHIAKAKSLILGVVR